MSTIYFETIDCSTFSLKAGQALTSPILFWVMMSDDSRGSLLNFIEEIHIFFSELTAQNLAKHCNQGSSSFEQRKGFFHVSFGLAGWCVYFMKFLTFPGLCKTLNHFKDLDAQQILF